MRTYLAKGGMRLRAESLSPEHRREIATIASAAAVEARTHIPKRKRSEIAKEGGGGTMEEET